MNTDTEIIDATLDIELHPLTKAQREYMRGKLRLLSNIHKEIASQLNTRWAAEGDNHIPIKPTEDLVSLMYSVEHKLNTSPSLP